MSKVVFIGEVFMNQIPLPKAHPLKRDIETTGLTLWQVRKMLGGLPSEGQLSRYLNGIDELPFELEQRLTEIIRAVKEN